MTKVVVQLSHMRLNDEVTYRKGDIVEMTDAEIKTHGNSVKRLDDVNISTDGVPEAMQRKDALIKSLQAKIASLELDIIALKDAVKDDTPTPAQKQTRKLAKP